MYRFISIVIIVYFFTFSACSEPQLSNGTSSKAFFDLTDYFNSESVRLKSLDSLRKEISLNGKREVKTIVQPELTNEFNIFINSNINKTSWLGKYSVDSLVDDSGQLSRLTYKSVDEQLKTKFLEIAFQNRKISQINITNKTESFLVNSIQKLMYIPSEGFTISTQQNLLLSVDRKFNIRITYL